MEETETKHDLEANPKETAKKYDLDATTPEVEVDDGKKKKEKTEEEPTVGFIEYYRYATGLDWVLIAIGVFFAGVKGLSWPSIMIIFSEMIESLGDDQVKGNSPTGQMLVFAYWYIGFGLMNIVTGYISSAFINISAERQASKVRRAYFSALLRQEVGWYDTITSGELTTRLAGDVEKIRDGLSDKSGIFVQWMVCFFAGVIIAFFYSWRMCLVILAIAPLLGGGSAIFSKVLSNFTVAEQSAYAAAGGVVEEVIGAIRTVVAFGGEKNEVKRYEAKLEHTVIPGKRNQLIFGLSLAFVYMIMYLMYALAFWYGAKLTGQQTNTPADILIAFFNVLIGAWGLGLTAPQWKIMSVGRGAAQRIFATIDRESEINHEEDTGIKLPDLEGRIEFRNCYFHYPTRPDVPIMKDFNLILEPGQTHALVGPSGCGKSTAVSLLERFYEVLEGEIYLDGTNIKELNLKWFREQVGLVSQEPVLFATTVEENVRYGREGVTKEEIVAACEKAFAHDFISQLPQGYDTLCGERGSQMSGGQKQRIAIARALVRNPKILLLDEATSALDNKSEKIVQKALDKAREGRTTLIIAHRLSTIRDVDKICAVANGEITEEGTHEELMKYNNGLYKSLVMYQQAVQDEDTAAMHIPGLPTTLQEIKNTVTGESKVRQRKSSPKELEEEELLVAIEGSKEAEVVEESVPPATFLQIVRECNTYEIVMIVLGSLGAAANGATMPAFAILFAEMLNDLATLNANAQAGVEELDYGPTNRMSSYFVIIAAVIGTGYFTQLYCTGLMSESFTRRLRIRSFKALLRQNLEYFDHPDNSVGALTTRLSTEACSVKDATGSRVAIIVQCAVGMGAGIIIAFTASWKLALVCMACMPFIVIGGIVQMWQVTGTTEGVAKLYEESGKIAAESIENMKTVASLGLERQFAKQYTDSIKPPLQASTKKAHIVGFCMGLSEAITFFTFAAVFGYGSTLMKSKEIDFEAVMKVFGGIIFAGMSVGEALSYLGDYGKATLAAGKIFKLIYYAPPIDAYSEEGLKGFSVEGTIQFKNVRFNYPTRPEQPVLQGLSFEAARGQTIALVGQSGCGKSTTIQLTERFYDAMSGNVLLDNRETCEINVGYLRQQIGLVSQEPVLFDTSIADNIMYGDLTRTVSQEEVIAAAKSANIHDFIDSLPEKYGTRVGEKGTQISGGQKQRIAIARALVRNPKILLLDEATSALDTESEKVVQEALDKARQGRTCLVIAHRLSTIHTADLICVIDEGRVAEQGTHQELMAMKGQYYALNINKD